jgi:hypothetical protein
MVKINSVFKLKITIFIFKQYIQKSDISYLLLIIKPVEFE